VSASRPTLKLEDHPLSAVHDCIFNIFTATPRSGDCSSNRNLRSRDAVVTGSMYYGSNSPYDHKILAEGESEASIVMWSGSTYIIWQFVVISVPM